MSLECIHVCMIFMHLFLAPLAQFRLFVLAMAVETLEDLVLDDEYSRLRADPSIAVFDLESALNRYFSKQGFRNMQNLVDLIRSTGLSWKGSAKVLHQ